MDDNTRAEENENGVEGINTKVAKPISVETILHMQDGTGEDSYARNSTFQATGMASVTDLLLQEASSLLHLPAQGWLSVADLGCAAGPNTISLANRVVAHLQEKSFDHGDALEFQLFFSDNPSNDFNTLFRSLPPLMTFSNLHANNINGHHIESSPGDECAKRWYFAAGVPGSFYTRLFPRNSLHLVVSFFALHWISKIPEIAQARSSNESNEGSRSLYFPMPEVIEDFTKQAHTDLCSFLNHRAEEIVSGGILFLVFLGRQTSSSLERQPASVTQGSKCYTTSCTSQDSRVAGHTAFLYHLLHLSFDDLVSEGLIDVRTKESFNLPYCDRDTNDIKKAVSESGLFTIRILEQQTCSFWSKEDKEEMEKSHEEVGRRCCKLIKSIVGSLVEAHIGSHLSQLFWDRFEKKAAENADYALNSYYYVANIVCLRRN
ncbi:hypothetical protein O6H91_21G028100 [Diphasiastrum complanatum]|uniref:Uncharacterized protein n=1 Tax=Diphasiastrum complanatum TaxID=34168 RepID=A0ACC2AJ36_DIPCM|nr:hypothetical protein O6H91_21G028100 [Diphasiastrum complanatum]